jgi:hypothetical protein
VSLDTDAGLKELAGLKNLQTLDLSGTKVTGEGLKELAALKNLQSLDLRETQVTDTGVRALQKDLKDINVRFDEVVSVAPGPAELKPAEPKIQQTTTLSLGALKIGEIGMLNDRQLDINFDYILLVDRVLSENEVLIRDRVTVNAPRSINFGKVTGTAHNAVIQMPTKGLVDNARFDPNDTIFEVAGTKKGWGCNIFPATSGKGCKQSRQGTEGEPRRTTSG